MSERAGMTRSRGVTRGHGGPAPVVHTASWTCTGFIIACAFADEWRLWWFVFLFQLGLVLGAYMQERSHR